MQWFSALIPAYPHIQQKAHEELDRVVGRNRLPTVEDEKNLPYIRAIIKVRASRQEGQNDALCLTLNDVTLFIYYVPSTSRKSNGVIIRSGSALPMSTPKTLRTAASSSPKIQFWF